MKKSNIILIITLIVTAFVLTGCKPVIPSLSEITTNGDNLITKPTIPDVVPSVPDTPAPSQVPTEESTSQTEELTTATAESTVVGYTSKGYAITQEDGIYYVDGVLLANKTYPLPSSYNPGTLLSECSVAFDKMKADASAQGMSIWNASGFRSYDLQDSLYTRYSNRDGKAAADRYSARPGHSEHQTGLAIDLNEINSAFANTAEGKWIAENCWKYGFILRYMQEKEAQTGYMYEPWHIRYVGVEVAEKIYNSGLCLEEYYGITSAYGDPVVPADGKAPEEITTSPQVNIPEEVPVVG